MSPAWHCCYLTSFCCYYLCFLSLFRTLFFRFYRAFCNTSYLYTSTLLLWGRYNVLRGVGLRSCVTVLAKCLRNFLIFNFSSLSKANRARFVFPLLFLLLCSPILCKNFDNVIIKISSKLAEIAFTSFWRMSALQSLSILLSPLC